MDNITATKLSNDPDKKTRKARHLCKNCFYEPVVSGCAMTDYHCQKCTKEFTHSNTNIPRFCEECAEAFKKCKQCGDVLS